MCDVTPAARFPVPMDARAAGLSRQFLREALCTTHHARVLDDAELLVSELITNGIRHGAPPVVLEVSCDGSDGLQVAVSDGNPDAPEHRKAVEDAESGRGITLVDLLSDDWGVDPRADGKTTWFRLDRRPTGEPAPAGGPAPAG